MARYMTVLPAAAMVLATCLSACGGKAGPAPVRAEAVGRDANTPMSGRRCQLASSADELPDFNSLVRVGTRGDVSLWGVDLPATDTVVVSVRYNDDGRLDWVEVIETSLTSDRVTGLERLLLASLNERGPQDWGVRIRLVGGDVADLEPSVICQPEVRAGLRRPVVPMVTSGRDVRALERARGIRYPVQIFIDSQGRITNVRLPRPSGDTVVDQFLTDWALSTSFRPKLHDGIAMPAVVEQSLYIPQRRR